MTILNQPDRLVSFCFGETTWIGASKNIVRRFESIFESSKFLHDKMSSNEETLQIHKYWYMIVSLRRLRSMRLRCIVDFYIVFKEKSGLALR